MRSKTNYKEKLVKRSCKKYHRWLYMNSWDSYTDYKFIKRNNGRIMMEIAVCYDCEQFIVIKKMPVICLRKGAKHEWKKLFGEKNKKFCQICMIVK